MDIATLLRTASPERCRELSDLFARFAELPRDETFAAQVERVIEQVTPKDERGMAELLKEARLAERKTP